MEDTISEAMRSLPPHFRFHVTDEELLILYLKPKILGHTDQFYYNIIPEIDICDFEPWQLSAMFDHMFNRNELFFYGQVKHKYLNRRSRAGYWKVTGKDRAIMSEDTNEQIGIKKTLVFYEGRAPRGKRTNWIMHEYHLNSKCLGDNHDEGEMLPYVACRIKNKKDKKVRELMESLKLDDCVLDSSNAPTYQPQAAVYAQPEMSVRELMESLKLDDCVSNSSNAPTYQPQAAVYAEPEISLKELMNSLPPAPSETPDDHVSNRISTPPYSPQAAAEEGLSPFFDDGYSPSSYSDFDLGWGDV